MKRYLEGFTLYPNWLNNGYDRCKDSLARVAATYIAFIDSLKYLTFCSSESFLTNHGFGKLPSKRPSTNTCFHSRPFAE